MLQCIRDRIDIAGIQGYNPGFPLPEAATTALHTSYKCYAASGTEPRVAFPVCNAVEPYVLETIYSPSWLATALRLQLPNELRRTIVSM